MDNPITYALAYIRRYVPVEILQYAYLTDSNFKLVTAASLDDMINKHVIYPVVLVDCDLIGGTQTVIPLDPSSREQVDQFTSIIRVPMKNTNNRKITTVLSIGYGSVSNNGYGQGIGAGFMSPGMNQNYLLGAASGVWFSNTPIPMMSTARCTIIGDNTILVQDSIIMPPIINVRCWLENEEGLSGLKKPSYPFFAQLALHAVQADLWTRLKIKIDQGQVEGGSEIGAFKEIVESYSDAKQNYRDYFDNDWAQVTRFDDKESNNRKIRYALGGRH